jgi:oxygen-independent coproporphyrinogen-3 oxidase
LDLARENFPRFSFDLIYARPGQSLDHWKAELARALSFEPQHLSLYQLTMEPGTAFHTAWRRGGLILPEEDLAADLYEFTQSAMDAAGLPAYEISNHAVPGRECRHNMIYWQAGDYLGIGPGAHGRLTDPSPVARFFDLETSEAPGLRIATRLHRAPEVWLQRVEDRGHACQELRPLAINDRLEELLMMGLRLRTGVSRELFQREVSEGIEDSLPCPALFSLNDAGLLALDNQGLRATAAGRQRLNAILTYLLPEAAPVPSGKSC